MKAPATESQKTRALARPAEQLPGQLVAPQTTYRRTQMHLNGLTQADILTMQRTVGNRGVQQMLAQHHDSANGQHQTGTINRGFIQQPATLLVQRDKTSDKLKDLDARTQVLEKKAAATQLDLKYRALFGAKISTYKQIVYRLTGAFQAALSGYQGAHGEQAAKDAVIDQVVTTLILVAAATALEPFLMLSLGKLHGPLGKVSKTIGELPLDKLVEKVENPANAAISGTGNTVTTKRAGERAADARAAGLPPPNS